MTSVGVMASGVVTAGPCTVVLEDSLDHAAAWSISGTPVQVTGRTGNAMQITGLDYLQYSIAAGSQSPTLTVGFAYRRTDALTTVRDIISMRQAGSIAEWKLKLDPTTDTITVTTTSSDTVIGTSAPGVVAVNTWAYIEAQVFAHDTIGTATVKVDGTTVIAVTNVDTLLGTGVALVRLNPTTTNCVGQYDDFYLSSGSGCPFRGSQTFTSPQAFKASLGSQAETVSGATIVITTTAAIAVDDLIVVRAAADNLSATTPTFTCADSAGNSYTTHTQASRNATPGAACAGALMAAKATSPVAAGGTITVTLSGAVAARVAYAESFTGYTNTPRSAAVVTTGLSTAANSPAFAGALSGDLVLGLVAAETRTTSTGDNDTTAGAWSTLAQFPNATSGTPDTNFVLASGQYKIVAVTLAATQTYNNTIGASTEWVDAIVGLQHA